jgi:hypothetical protein
MIAGYTKHFESQVPNCTNNFGITSELTETIIGMATKKAVPVKTSRSQLLAQAREAAFLGFIPQPLTITSESNKGYEKKAMQLWELAFIGDIAGVKAMAITGTNGYAKAIREYQDILISVLEKK